MMNYGFPLLLAGAFGASFLLALLDTGRKKVILLCVAAVWGLRVGQAEIALLDAGTPQAYAWLALLCLSAWLPAFAAAMIGTDLGARLRRLLSSARAAGEETADAPVNE